MTQNDLFADERIQFYLRNRQDIKAWAAIESDVAAATRELLERSQPEIEARMLAVDPSAIVGRHDSGSWQRILTQQEGWPTTVGMALEWHRSPDPLGTNRPKIGLFWWADPRSLIEPRTRLTQEAPRKPLQDLGYKVPLDSVWPVGAFVTASADWWQDPDVWIAGIVERLVATWPIIQPVVEDALVGVDWQVSGG